MTAVHLVADHQHFCHASEQSSSQVAKLMLRMDLLPANVGGESCKKAGAKQLTIDFCEVNHLRISGAHQSLRARQIRKMIIHMIGMHVGVQATMAAEACVRYASEARRLQPQSDADALAALFDGLHASLERMCM